MFFDYLCNPQNKRELINSLSVFNAEELLFFNTSTFETSLELCRSDSFEFSKPKVVKIPTEDGSSRVIYILPREEILLQKYVVAGLKHFLYSEEDNYQIIGMFRMPSPFDLSKKIKKIYADGMEYCFHVDVKKYSESVERTSLLQLIKQYFSDDEEVFSFFEKYFSDNPVIRSGEPISNFFGHLYLKPVDEILRKNNAVFLRYIDSYWVFTKTQKEAQDAKALVLKNLHLLNLTEKPQKKCIITSNEICSIMGYVLYDNKLHVAQSLSQRYCKTVKEKAIQFAKYAHKKSIRPDIAMWQFIQWINSITLKEKLDIKLFRNNPDYQTLKSADKIIQDAIRIVGTGKQSPARYRVTYKQIKELGYTTLVNKYYTWRDKVDNL